MHPSAKANCQAFFDSYSMAFRDSQTVQVVEIGAQDVNGSLRNLCPKRFKYVGLDFVEGNGVDIVMDDPYAIPSGSTDIVLSSSCFEHSEMFWMVFLEILRVLKPHGIFYLNAPSNGDFHRYPVDCWRFYPDCGTALVTWARRNGIAAKLLESYTSAQRGGMWNDFVAVFLKDEAFLREYPERILDRRLDITNGLCDGKEGLIRQVNPPEDRRRLIAIQQILSNQVRHL